MTMEPCAVHSAIKRQWRWQQKEKEEARKRVWSGGRGMSWDVVGEGRQ